MQDDTILTGVKIHVLFFRVLARISVQEGNRGTVISRESILVRINVQEIKRRYDICEGVSTLCIEL